MDLTMKKFLIVDDEPKITGVIKSYLESKGCIVYEAYTGNIALDIFYKNSPDMLIIDLMLPDMSGEEICKKIRKNSNVPIIMLTAKVDENSILNGLNIGADDYITKPFSPKQLIARIEAIFRRTENNFKPEKNMIHINFDELILDLNNFSVTKHGKNIALTPNEFGLLSTLAKYPKKVFTRNELIHSVFGDDYEGFDRTIDAHIKNLRQKLETEPKNPKYVITVHGIGYRFGGEGQ